MFVSFGWYSKVSITESFILKELALHRIKNFKFNAFIKKGNTMPHIHMYTHTFNSYSNNKEWGNVASVPKQSRDIVGFYFFIPLKLLLNMLLLLNI